MSMTLEYSKECWEHYERKGKISCFLEKLKKGMVSRNGESDNGKRLGKNTF
jgi:hypothetical protein